ncbi:MAG: tetratricopeptide repeat protein [Leptolyngbyaceae cyanobacterium CAN_BIN12]|nr:tetratricopeptide repeat protein [Leptolyngbyaceae cyanobacterium CAN_BIN12]
MTWGETKRQLFSYEKAVEINPDYHEAWYNKACCSALLGKPEEAIENLQRAIELHPHYREMAKTDADFDGIRQDARFQALVGE